MTVTTRLVEPSPPWCIRLLADLATADERTAAVAKTLNTQQLNWKPRPEAWSIGQCIDHLYVANQVYVQAIARSLRGHRHAVVDEITPGWFGRWFIRSYIEPSAQGKRRRAPKKIAPAAQVDTAIVDRFLRSNDDARALVQRASAYDVNRIRFRNPFIPIIHFTVGTGLEILTRHQHRHLLQAEGVRQSPDFPA